MKAWKSKGLWIGFLLLWIGFLLLLALLGTLYGMQARQHRIAPDAETQMIRRLAATNNPTLAELLDRAVIFIPAGEFLRGNNSGSGNDGPQQLVYLDAYAMDRYEVTNIQYLRFLLETGRKAPSYWEEGKYPAGQADHPVVGISWEAANAYCAWAGKRLPTEAEWEKACRGPDGNLYPWGNRWNARLANVGDPKTPLPPEKQDGSPTAWAYAWELLQTIPETNQLGLRPVGLYPAGASYYGIMDLAGNASEWVFDWYNWGDYSGMSTRNPVNLEPPWNRCVRGGAWHNPAGDADQIRVSSLCSARSSAHSISDPRTGFRCAASVSYPPP
jgi:formylglycine-generating enzyme required for sulfatase activity